MLVVAPAFPAGSTQGWTVTGSMSTPRGYHTATMFDDGMILIAGGCSNINRMVCIPRATAELYDPATQTWKSTGSMSVARIYHTAALLDDGTVLVAGGTTLKDGFQGPVATADLYDPATGIWTPTAAMTIARSGHTATLLGDGTVLVAGGYSIPVAELYDPIAGTWTVTGSMREARGGHTATLLDDGGTVLVAGGFNNQSLATAERYDLLSGTWQPTKNMNRPRALHTATSLDNGTVLVTGGVEAGGPPRTYEATTELCNPATHVWMQPATMREARGGHTATLLSDGHTVLVAGGYTSYLWVTATAELYGTGRVMREGGR